MKILTWRERHKPGIRAATDPTIAELMQAEIDELRAALKAQPVQEPIYQYQMGDGSWVDQTQASYEYNKRHAPNATVRIVYAAPVQPAQPAPLTDSQASTIARLIANRNAELCNVDPDDNWKIYGQDFIDEVRFFEAAVRTGGAG